MHPDEQAIRDLIALWHRATAAGEVDPAVGVLPDDDDVGDRFPPRELVAVVLVRADQDDRPLIGRDVRPQAVALVEAGRDPQLQDPDEEVDRAGHARAAEDHRMVVGVAPHG